MKWNDWTLLGLGIWLILSPWILGFSAYNLAAWNCTLIGVLTVIFSLWNFSGPQSQ